MVGKLAKVRISSRKRSISDLNQSSVRCAMASASGMLARMRSRFSAVSGSETPPGTTQAGWMRLPASHSMICWPNWRRRMPSRASVGMALHHAEDVARGGVGIHAEEQVGRRQIEEAEGVRLHDLRQVEDAAQARGVGRNAHGQDGVAGLGGGDQVADRADAADARHQRRHLGEGPAFAELLEAAELRDVEVGLFDAALARRGGSRSWSGPRCG